MELIDYLRMLARRWRWVVACTLVGWLLGALWVAQTPRVYEASAQLFVGLRGDNDISASRFILERMDSYAALVDSSEVTRAVNDELKLVDESEDIAGLLSADVAGNTVELGVTATSDEPAVAASVANVAAARLGDLIEAVEAPGNGAASPVQVTVTRPASEPGGPISPNVKLALALGMVAGLGVGLLVAALRDQALANRAVSPSQLDPAVPMSSVPVAADPAAARGADAQHHDRLGVDRPPAGAVRRARTVVGPLSKRRNGAPPAPQDGPSPTEERPGGPADELPSAMHSPSEDPGGDQRALSC